MQVSREQVRVKRGLGGRLQLLNKGIGICRILSSDDEPCTLHQGESRTLHPGDCIKLMKVVRSCECSVSRCAPARAGAETIRSSSPPSGAWMADTTTASHHRRRASCASG